MNSRVPTVPAAALLLALLAAGSARAGSLNGIAGAMPAYYDGVLHTINFKPQSDPATQALLSHNGSINTIYMSDQRLPGGAMFVAVLDAIQGDGFNPLWQEVSVTFTEGHTPRQLTSDTDVLAAAASGEVALSPTGEIYRCSVVGKSVSPAGAGPRASAAPAGASASRAPSWGELKARYR